MKNYTTQNYKYELKTHAIFKRIANVFAIYLLWTILLINKHQLLDNVRMYYYLKAGYYVEATYYV